jgi:hypothetical protein
MHVRCRQADGKLFPARAQARTPLFLAGREARLAASNMAGTAGDCAHGRSASHSAEGSGVPVAVRRSANAVPVGPERRRSAHLTDGPDQQPNLPAAPVARRTQSFESSSDGRAFLTSYCEVESAAGRSAAESPPGVLSSRWRGRPPHLSPTAPGPLGFLSARDPRLKRYGDGFVGAHEPPQGD